MSLPPYSPKQHEPKQELNHTSQSEPKQTKASRKETSRSGSTEVSESDKPRWPKPNRVQLRAEPKRADESRTEAN